MKRLEDGREGGQGPSRTVEPWGSSSGTYKRNIRERLFNHCCSGKVGNITYSECVCVALVMQHTKRMRRTILYHIFTHNFMNGAILREKVIGYKMFILLSLQTLPNTRLGLRTTQQDVNVNARSSFFFNFVLPWIIV